MNVRTDSIPTDPVASQRMLCWSCGYDVTGVDLARSAYRCPECGEHNIPGDPYCSPYSPRPWPHPVVLAAQMLWPGVCLGAAAIIAMGSWEALVLGAYTALLAFITCIAWPLAISELMLLDRVPGVRRGRLMLLLSLGGMIANLTLAVILFVLASLLRVL